MGLARGAPEEIASNGFEGEGTPDGRTLVFLSTEIGRDGLWKINADGRQRVQLVPGHVRSPVVTPDGRSVIFLSNRRRVLSPWMVSIDGGEPTQLVNIFAGTESLDVSPDGKAIVFRSRDDQGRSITIVCDRPACTSRRNLPFLKGDCDGRLTVVRLPTGYRTSGSSRSTVRPLASSRASPTPPRLPTSPGRTTASASRSRAPRSATTSCSFGD